MLKLNIFLFTKFFFVSSVGQRIISNLFLQSFHNNFLNIFNFGYPEIRRINLHLKLNNNISNNGKEEIR